MAPKGEDLKSRKMCIIIKLSENNNQQQSVIIIATKWERLNSRCNTQGTGVLCFQILDALDCTKKL